VGLNYDNANRRTCLTLPNGVVMSYVYDNASRVTSINYGTNGSCISPPNNLGGLTYTYDAKRAADGDHGEPRRRDAAGERQRWQQNCL
jgi:YD repeat-containing protein